MAPKVDIGIACSATQRPTWWTNLLTEILLTRDQGIEIGRIHSVSSALPDHKKNDIVSDTWSVARQEEKRRSNLTDTNRQKIVGSFLSGDSDWLFQIDDDTVPPTGALFHLLNLGRDFVAGLYFNPSPPHNPIAYKRREDGLYHAYYGYARGTLEQVDSVGMGCTLIHRSVFEKIMEEHKVYQRPNGTLIAVHKSKLLDNVSTHALNKVSPKVKQFVSKGWLCTRVVDPDEEDLKDVDDDSRTFPFYALEYVRTEDHHFCELADNVGIKPWIDTTITCKHIKPMEIEEHHYLEHITKLAKEGKL